MPFFDQRIEDRRRPSYRLHMVFVWAIFVLSLLPFALMFGDGASANAENPNGFHEGYFSVLQKWSTDTIEPVQELRPLRAFPSSWTGRWFDVDKNYANFEKWFSDHLGLRDLMIRGKNEVDYRLFRSSTRVYFGKKGDIYGRHLVDDELPMTETVLDSPKKIEEIHRGIVRYSEKLKAQGVTVIFITPMQKEYFYPGRLPFFAPKLPLHTNFMAFYERLKSDSEIHFIDVYKILNSGKDKFPIFYRQDFHWTDMAALEVAKETTNLIAALENSPTRWAYPNDFEYKPFVGSDARFSARLFSQNGVPEPQLKKAWSFGGVHVTRPLDTKSTGIELETDMLDNPVLLPATCMYGNSFSDGMVRAGLFDNFQKFTTLDRHKPVQDVTVMAVGRCKYLIVQILDLSSDVWMSFKQ